MQSKMYLFDPQYESNAPAKSKFSSSFGSSRGEGKFADLRIWNYTFQILTRNSTFWAIYAVAVKLPVNMGPPDVLGQILHSKLTRVGFMESLRDRISQGKRYNKSAIHVQ